MKSPRKSETLEKGRIRSVVMAADAAVGRAIGIRLDRLSAAAETLQVRLEAAEGKLGDAEIDIAVVAVGAPAAAERADRLAGLRSAMRSVLSRQADQVILISSGAVYGVDHHLVGFLSEDSRRCPAVINAEVRWWKTVEETAREEMEARPGAKLLVLRMPFIVGSDGNHFLDRILKRGWFVRYAGFNPPMQFVSVNGLARAVECAAEEKLSGVYHAAPGDIVPLLSMLKSMGVRSIPVPRVLHYVFRPILFRFLDGIATVDEVDCCRYPWTLSGREFADATGLRLSSREALEEAGAEFPGETREFDRFGADEAYYRRKGRTIYRFAEEIFWRIESRGFEHLPGKGGAILVGPHRGFMPLDAVMMCHLIYRKSGRIARFLIHPTLAKFPVQAPFFQRMGGIIACQKNAEWVLESGEFLGVYPEGIRGAFKMYKDAYDFDRFGRPDYARWAMQFDVPVIPFAVIGSAEIFPILGKIKWRWLRNYLEWPFFPITPTFPLLPLPLPSKWHVEFLAPIDPSEIRKRAEELGEDPVAVFTESVRNAIDHATREMLSRRESIFRGFAWGDSGEEA